MLLQELDYISIPEKATLAPVCAKEGRSKICGIVDSGIFLRSFNSSTDSFFNHGISRRAVSAIEHFFCGRELFVIALSQQEHKETQDTSQEASSRGSLVFLSVSETGTELDTIAQISLPFVPVSVHHFHLDHSHPQKGAATDGVYILSSGASGDAKVVFVSWSTKVLVEEADLSSVFPGLALLSGVVSCKVQSVENCCVFALACTDGSLLVGVCDVGHERPPVWECVKMDGVLTSVAIFSHSSRKKKRGKNEEGSEGDRILEDTHVVVGGALGFAAVFWHLPGDPNWSSVPDLVPYTEGDSVLSVVAMDVTVDGFNEIILGTYSRHLLVFSVEVSHAHRRWTKCLSLDLHAPVTHLQVSDVTGDGVKELLAATTFGAHLFRVDLELCRQRILKCLAEV